MKAIVFGGTGFIGSHVVEQLHHAGHDVTVAARSTSNTTYVQHLGVKITNIDFSDFFSIANAIKGNDVVYNCTAGNTPEVELELTKAIIEASGKHGVSRFIQLSTVILYDFQSGEAMDEKYVSKIEFPIQKLARDREQAVQEMGRKSHVPTIILRPASTIGLRDVKSFFARLFALYSLDRYPLINSGNSRVSLVDTRDIGRAMVWLGNDQKAENDHEVLLLKGYDTTWKQLKEQMDLAAGRVAKTVALPPNLTNDQLAPYKLNEFAMKNLSVNRIWNDDKIRSLGFTTEYVLKDSVQVSVNELLREKGTN